MIGLNAASESKTRIREKEQWFVVFVLFRQRNTQSNKGLETQGD